MRKWWERARRSRRAMRATYLKREMVHHNQNHRLAACGSRWVPVVSRRHAAAVRTTAAVADDALERDVSTAKAQRLRTT